MLVELLSEKVCYVTLTFSDLSERSYKTTLNPELLKEYNVLPREEAFFDLRTGEFVPFRRDAVSVRVDTDTPVYDKEVNKFANRFI